MTSKKKTHTSGNLNQIALSLSGGGVRAVGFHLGTMSMLERLGLLENVEIISSVSGGSLPGIGYSLTQKMGRSFQDFFNDYYDFLPKINIMEELLGGIVNTESPSPSGKRDMISALANVYDEFYFSKYFGKNLTFGTLMNPPFGDPPPEGSKLKEMIFNATEFKTGTAFRFQVSEYRCLIGNGKLSLCRDHASQIRVADIMAASSCIPVGMEPIFFPDDFRWPDDPAKGQRKNETANSTFQQIRATLIKNTDTHESSFALMDGGVYDNQGITSTLLALNRRKDKIAQQDSYECGTSLSLNGRGEPVSPEDNAKWMSGQDVHDSKHKSIRVKPEDLDLLIISDTPIRKASFFPKVLLSSTGKPETQGEGGERKAQGPGILGRIKQFIGNRTLGQASAVTWAILIALILSSITTAFEAYLLRDLYQQWVWHAYVLLHMILPLVLMVVMVVALSIYKRFKRESIEKLQEMIPNWKRNPKKYINKLRIADLMTMGGLRVGSTSALTSAIFMNRIRGMGYSTAFSRKDLRDKILTNEIFALQNPVNSNDSFHTMLTQEKAWPIPAELSDIVGVAATMPTKLWVDSYKGDPLNDLDYLVVCGQATICYNLLQYLWNVLREDDESWIDPDMKCVFENALAEWKKLMNDPLSLLKDRKRQSNVKELMAHAEELQKLQVAR